MIRFILLGLAVSLTEAIASQFFNDSDFKHRVIKLRLGGSSIDATDTFMFIDTSGDGAPSFYT